MNMHIYKKINMQTLALDPVICEECSGNFPEYDYLLGKKESGNKLHVYIGNGLRQASV